MNERKEVGEEKWERSNLNSFDNKTHIKANVTNKIVDIKPPGFGQLAARHSRRHSPSIRQNNCSWCSGALNGRQNIALEFAIVNDVVRVCTFFYILLLA